MSLIERGRRERIVLVGVAIPPATLDQAESSLDELAALIDTAGADEADRVLQRRDAPDPATFVGKGKAEELRELSYAVDADTVVFDEELTPAQSRNLEKILGRTAIDRSAVILDIFAQHAHSQEGKAQVELAMLRYRLPRLRGKGKGLSQQAGGIGTRRGPGETQLEVDRRRLVRRVTKLEGDLKVLTKNRRTQRKARAGRGSTPSPSSGTPTPASPRCSTGSPTPGFSWRTGCSRPSTRPRGAWTSPAASRFWSPTPSGSCASCPTSWWRPSGRRSTRWSRPTC